MFSHYCSPSAREREREKEERVGSGKNCTRMIKTIILAVLLGIVGAELESYRPRGWRPAGPSFEPGHSDRLQTYGSPPPSQSYGYPSNRPAYPKPPTTTSEPPRTTTERREIATTTTPSSREPTTSPNIPDQDYESNPALAIANSFAFNRPVYVYNTFPAYQGLTFLK